MDKPIYGIPVGVGGGDSTQADWNQTDETKADYIKNKPEILTETDVKQIIAETGGEDGPTVISIQADWEQTDETKPDYIKNKPEVLTKDDGVVEPTPDTIARRGSYGELYATNDDISGDPSSYSDYIAENEVLTRKVLDQVIVTRTNTPGVVYGNDYQGKLTTYGIATDLTGSDDLVTDALVSDLVKGKPGRKTVGMTYIDSDGNTHTCGVGEVFNVYIDQERLDEFGHPTTGNLSSAFCSHAEGNMTAAMGDCAHTEGFCTIASAFNSHAEGEDTIASSENQHVQGKFNIPDSENKYADIIGNGTDEARSNAYTLDWSGNAWFAGDVKVGGTGQDDAEAKTLATMEYIDSAIQQAILDSWEAAV